MLVDYYKSVMLMQDINARSQALISEEYVEGRFNESGTVVIMENVTRKTRR